MCVVASKTGLTNCGKDSSDSRRVSRCEAKHMILEQIFQNLRV